GRELAVFLQMLLQPGREIPAALGQTRREPLGFALFSLAIVVLDHAPFFGQKMRGAVRLERESHTAAAQNQSARRYGQLQKSPALVHVRCLRRSFKSGLLVMSFAVGGAVAVGAAGADDAVVRAGRAARAGDDAAAIETVGVAAALARGCDNAVAGALAVALTRVAMRFAAS